MIDRLTRKRQQVGFYIQKLQELRDSSNANNLPGLGSGARIEAWARQIADSVRRIEYCHYIRERHYDNSPVIDPANSFFYPLKAAVNQNSLGNIDNACWLIFLATHFGKHAKQSWWLTRMIYGGSAGRVWDWAAVSNNFQDFYNWLIQHQRILSVGKFSNHRRYESKNASKNAEIFRSYINWIRARGGWTHMLEEIQKQGTANPKAIFGHLYQDMAENVKRFGRLGRFDYLAMLGKLGIADIEPDSAYLQGATGPLRGARLLFGGNSDIGISPAELNERVLKLGNYLDVNMQVMEDSLCNWQKSPDCYIGFRG